jgi:hypothetical protein
MKFESFARCRTQLHGSISTRASDATNHFTAQNSEAAHLHSKDRDEVLVEPKSPARFATSTPDSSGH